MHMLTTVFAALVGAALFEALRVPAGALIGSAVAVGALNLSQLEVAQLPNQASFVVFAALGWLIGQGISNEVVRRLAAQVLPITVAVVLLLLFGAILAVIAVRLGITDPATAFLATSPGGLSQMAAMSAAVGADAATVVTLHTVRVLLLILLAPVVLRILPSG